MGGFLRPTVGLLLLFAQPSCADLNMYDARLCYILDGFLAMYGLVITAFYIKEKFFTSKTKKDRGNRFSNRSQQEGPYTELKKKSSSSANDEYRELPLRGNRNKDHQVYQDLNEARDRDTYNTLQPSTPSR